MFSTVDICVLTGLPPTTIVNWIVWGVVTPAWTGKRGRGNGHRWSARQALGLGFAAALHRSERGCSPEYAGKLVRYFEGFSDEELSNWLRHDGPVAARPSWCDPNARKLPGDEYTEEDVAKTLNRVESAIRLKQSMGEDPSPEPAPVKGRRVTRLARKKGR